MGDQEGSPPSRVRSGAGSGALEGLLKAASRSGTQLRGGGSRERRLDASRRGVEAQGGARIAPLPHPALFFFVALTVLAMGAVISDRRTQAGTAALPGPFWMGENSSALRERRV